VNTPLRSSAKLVGMPLVDLSHPLKPGAVSFPAEPKFLVSSHRTIAKDRFNISKVEIGTHQGTHIDAMAHFFEQGRTVGEMPLEWFYGPARLLRIPKAAGCKIGVGDLRVFDALIEPEAKIILETGWHRKFGDSAFFTDYPFLTLDAVEYLAARKIRLLGLDIPTVGRTWYELHRILLSPESEVVVLESLANLDQIPESFTLAAFPLPLEGLDGSPVRAVAIF
jgi:kynurenine formamidase